MSEIELKSVGISYRGRAIIKNISFVLNDKSITGILGPSGAGKTTLLRAMNRLLDDEPGYKQEGQIFFNGVDIGAEPHVQNIRRNIGLIFQRPVIYPISILKNVLFGVHHLSLVSKSKYEETAERYLKQAFLWDEVKDRLHESALKLSVGQQQRLAIARSLAVEPKALLFDEPTSSLDNHATSRIEELIQEQAKTKTVGLVTHDREQAKRLAHHLIELKSF